MIIISILFSLQVNVRGLKNEAGKSVRKWWIWRYPQDEQWFVKWRRSDIVSLREEVQMMDLPFWCCCILLWKCFFLRFVFGGREYFDGNFRVFILVGVCAGCDGPASDRFVRRSRLW